VSQTISPVAPRSKPPAVNLDDFAKARLEDLIYAVRTWGLQEGPGRYPIAVVPGTGLLRLRARYVVPAPVTVPHDVYIDITEIWQATQRHLYALPRTAAAEQHGFWLDEFSYQLVVDDVRWRYDLDYDRHRGMPLHEHPRGRPEDERVLFAPRTSGDLVTAGHDGLLARLMEQYAKALGPWPP
jgi:hypothetical protein